MAGNKYLKNNAGKIQEEAAIQSSAGAGDAGKIGALDSAGRWDASMMPVGFGSEVQSIVAYEDLAAGDFVNVFNDGGTTKVRKADASGGDTKKADGYVIAAHLTGATASVYYGNINNQLSGMTKGAIQYLSGGTPGARTETAPSTATHIVQRLGKAISATEMLVEIQDTITLA